MYTGLWNLTGCVTGETIPGKRDELSYRGTCFLTGAKAFPGKLDRINGSNCRFTGPGQVLTLTGPG